MENISLYDAQITGIEHREESHKLFMKALLSSGKPCQISFEAVEWWELCSFGIKNVLVSIEGYEGDSLTEDIVMDQDLSDQYVKSVMEGLHTLFVLKASIGLSGWIIAAQMNLTILPEKP